MSNQIQVEKGIPLPSTTKKGKYPWDKLEIGDSFLADGARIGNITGSRIGAQRRTGFKFISRTVENGVRIWRIE